VAQLRKELPALPPLVLVLKQFLYEKKLNQAYTGGLCSYALLLTVANHLRNVPHDIQARPGVLLLSYLDSWHTNDKHRESRHKAGESGHADGPNPAPADSERPRMNKEKCHQVCHYYNVKSGCRAGEEKCPFVHICEAHLRGACKFGPKCRRSHSIDGTKWARAGVSMEQIRLRDGRAARKTNDARQPTEKQGDGEDRAESERPTLDIRDPTDRKNNVAQGCWKSMAVQRAMWTARGVLRKRIFDSTCRESVLHSLQTIVMKNLARTHANQVWEEQIVPDHTFHESVLADLIQASTLECKSH